MKVNFNFKYLNLLEQALLAAHYDRVKRGCMLRIHPAIYPASLTAKVRSKSAKYNI